MACNPLPHSRFSVKAGVSTGRPPPTAATRPRYMSLTSVWITWPKTAWPTSAGSTAARPTASRTTVAARSHGGTAARPPPYLPIAVRDPVKHLVRDGGQHVGGDESRGDRVHGQADAVAHRALSAAELEDRLLGQRLRQSEETRLRCRVVDLADIAGFPDD